MTSETERPLAVVHLTWGKKHDPFWPSTSFYSSWDDWVENCLNGDALEYASDDEINAAELLRRYACGERMFAGICLADGSVLNGAVIPEATFQDGFFSGVDVRNADLRRTTFRNMNLKTTDFGGADLTDAVFEYALIESAIFRGATIKNTIFRKMMAYGKREEDFRPDDWH